MRYIWRIVQFTSALWRYYAAIGLFTVLLALMTLMQPLLSGWAIDEMRKGTEASVQYVVILAALIFLLDLFSNVFSNISGFLGDRMAVKVQNYLSLRYYQQLLSLPQQYYDTELSGKIINRLNRSVRELSNFLNMLSNNFLQFIFSTIFSLIVVAIYSPVVAFMLFLLYPIYVYLTTRTSGKWQTYQTKINKHWDIAAGRFAEVIGQIKVVKSFNQEKREYKVFKRHAGIVDKTELPQSKFWHTTDVYRRLVLNVIFFGVYLYIFVQGARGEFTPGQSVALILYAMQIRIPIFTISFLVDRTQRAVADSKDYFEIMTLEPSISDKPDAMQLQVKRADISFDSVNFGYEKNKQVLKRISFSVNAGSKVALVGESGEGKTTITNLLMRLYEPQSGKITVDGQNIASVTQTSLRDAIAVVFQDPALFSGTIRENIAYANPLATEEQIKEAAKAANADEFISRFEKGYESEIGERGLKLSGGQKQRIAIARALLKDAPILILDEATSSLDSKSEALVQEALERLMKGRTTLIIAHRLSTIQQVDQIITIRNGEIDEIGAPTDLAITDGIYAQLLRLQQGKNETSKKKLQQFEISA